MLFFMACVVPALIGTAFVLVSRKWNMPNAYGEIHRLTWPEYGTVAVLTIIVALFVTVIVGPSAAKAQAAEGYQEFWNGSIVDAYVVETACTRDGPCVYEYDCDPYLVPYTVQVPAGTDSKGNTIYRTETRYRTEYHRCPYATHEYQYRLADNIGRDFAIGGTRIAEQALSWRSGTSIPGNLDRGIPTRWLQSKTRLESGDAEPVTKTNTYTNYILPSDNDVLEEFSASIESYLEAGLLPEHTLNMGNGDMLYDNEMQATKVQFIGVNSDTEKWNERLMRFNAALGSELQGDMHIVVVNSAQVTNPFDYTNALKAYWVNELGKWSFPKNGIVVAIGTDGTTIQWASAATGMPEGNGGMISAIQNGLTGQPLDPDIVLGVVTAEPYTREDGKKKVSYEYGDGILARIVFEDFPFMRACMKCDDADDTGTGFVYLKDSIPVSTGAKLLMFFIVLAISVISYTVFLFIDPFKFLTPRTHRTYNKRTRRYYR